MKYLIVDSCSLDSYISVVGNSSLLIQATFDTYNATETFFVELQNILSQYPLETLDFLAVCKGPGSFTSTRICMMSIKTLCYAKKIPLITFDSHIPLRTKDFQNQVIMTNLTKKGATLSTGGKQPKFISTNDLTDKPPSKLLTNPPYNNKVLYTYLETKAKQKNFCDPQKVLPVYLTDP